jgi:hypothetical protein
MVAFIAFLQKYRKITDLNHSFSSFLSLNKSVHRAYS